MVVLCIQLKVVRISICYINHYNIVAENVFTVLDLYLTIDDFHFKVNVDNDIEISFYHIWLILR